MKPTAAVRGRFSPRRVLPALLAFLALCALLNTRDPPSTRLPYLAANVARDKATGAYAPPPAGHPALRPDAPPFCAALMANPRPYRKDVSGCEGGQAQRDDFNDKCGRFFSQFLQDIWVWLAVARHMHRGVYVDVGANQPEAISNSYFLDRCLGWRGVCVEGQEKYHAALRDRRTCEVVGCVSSKRENVSYVGADDLGGIERDNKNVNGTQDWQQKAHEAPTNIVQCVPLRDVFEKQGIRHVTYMSLDVEGSEMAVLKGIDWEKTEVWFISVEGSWKGEAGSFLRDMGYVVIQYVKNVGDAFYASPQAVREVEKAGGVGFLERVNVPDV